MSEWAFTCIPDVLPRGILLETGQYSNTLETQRKTEAKIVPEIAPVVTANM